MTIWTGSETKGKERMSAQFEGLGSVVIHREKDGLAVDINGRRAWSSWKDSVKGIQLSIQTSVAEWNYLNSFTTER